MSNLGTVTESSWASKEDFKKEFYGDLFDWFKSKGTELTGLTIDGETYKFSRNGVTVTFKNAVNPCEVAKFVPDDRLLIETDAPYMTPVPFRGKRCDSLHIPYTAEKIAELRGCTAQEVLDLTDKNARELFNIK